MPGTLWRRLKYWLSTRREQAGVEQEMRLHVQLRAGRLRDAGMDESDALLAARRRFGNQLQLRETIREMWINRWFDDFLRDVQIGSRGLARSPGFTAVAILTVALALGANTAIFSVINTVLLKPLSYREAGQIVQIVRAEKGEGRWPSMSAAQFLYIKDHMTALSSVGAMDFAAAGFSLSGAGEPERISGSRITAEIFDTLSMAPIVGRVFGSSEEDVAVISNSLWQRRFGGSESVLGSRLTLNGRPYAVVGVMPQGFLATGSAAQPEVWIPLRVNFDPADVSNLFAVVGRIKDKTTLENANAQLAQLARSMRSQFPNQVDERHYFEGVRYRDFLVGDMKPALLVLAGAVGLVLVLACANVANLLLARAISRQKEIAIRTAMGASRWRLLRQLLTESLLLSLSASALGLLLASIGMRALLRSLPESIPWSGDIRFDAPVLAFTVGLAILTGLLFGLAPAWPRGFHISETLKATSGRNTSAGSTARLRTGLVAVEVAVSVVLLVGGALLMQSFLRLRTVSVGFESSNVLTMKMSMQKHTTTSAAMRFLTPVLERVNASPGVSSAATVTSLPLELGPEWEFEVDGRADHSIDAQIRAVSPLYFEAMGIRLMDGRRFNDRENGVSAPVMIVNEAFARKAFKQSTAVGQQVRYSKRLGSLVHDNAAREIVGIVANVREEGLRDAPSPVVYIPQSQLSDTLGQMFNPVLPISLVVKTQGPPAQVVQSVKQIVASVDPQQPLAEIRSMSEIVDRATSRDRFNLTLMGIFAFVSLVLASIGIYGVVAYSVSQRTQELGVRIALGASFSDVMRLVIGSGMITSMIGVAAGLAGAYGLSRFLAQMLFSIQAADPVTFSMVAALMLAVAFLANLVPALRATRVDPITALRYE